MSDKKIVLPGGAGLVGQNLVPRLKECGYDQITVIDKHRGNLGILEHMHPDVSCTEADLSDPGDWMQCFDGAYAVVMLQAQIGGLDETVFQANNQEATANILEACKHYGVERLVHVSSSVVESTADDMYTRSKRAQEEMVLESGIPCPILRPTLMFGWFDRKHLGWLSRFLQRVPVFPIPGNGQYMRQPLYAGDFCSIIIRCIEERTFNGIYDISGHERIDYIDLIREIKRATGAFSLILKIPCWLFYFLLKLWALFDKNPPFTTEQLAALLARDEFNVIDWPGIFGVRSTPLQEALAETFTHPEYSKIVLEF